MNNSRHKLLRTLTLLFATCASSIHAFQPKPFHSGSLGPVRSDTEILRAYGIQLTKSALPKALNNQEPAVRVAAAGQLLENNHALDMIPVVQAALKDETMPSTRMGIALALAQIGDQAGILVLEGICKDPQINVGLRMATAMNLVGIGREHTAVDVVAQALIDKNDDPSRAWANGRVAALGVVPMFKDLSESDSERLFRLVIANLKDKNAYVRTAASECLNFSKRLSAVPELKDALSIETDPLARKAMENALANLTAQNESSRPTESPTPPPPLRNQ